MNITFEDFQRMKEASSTGTDYGSSMILLDLRKNNPSLYKEYEELALKPKTKGDSTMTEIHDYLDFVRCIQEINSLSEYSGATPKINEYQSMLSDLLETDRAKYQKYTERMKKDLERNEEIERRIDSHFD